MMEEMLCKCGITDCKGPSCRDYEKGNKPMKLFIFRPAELWEYCGGGLIILASSFEEAQKMALSIEEDDPFSIYKTDKDAEKNKNKSNCWVLVEEFNFPEEVKSRVILCDYNWA